MSAVPHAPLHFVDPRQFKANTREAVDDAHLRQSFRSAMDFLQTKRAAHFGAMSAAEPHFEPLRRVGEAIRQYSLSRLPDLLEQLEQRLGERGVHEDTFHLPDHLALRSSTRGSASLCDDHDGRCNPPFESTDHENLHGRHRDRMRVETFETASTPSTGPATAGLAG